MINIFNRKEVFITLDMHKMAQARDVLSAHGIECIVGTVNLLDYGGAVGSRRAYTGSFGIDQSIIYEYHLYVNKENYDRAMYLIGCVSQS